jgi:hypothetical protein
MVQGPDETRLAEIKAVAGDGSLDERCGRIARWLREQGQLESAGDGPDQAPWQDRSGSADDLLDMDATDEDLEHLWVRF